MRYKPDWPAARKRLTALWHDEVLDRPCIGVRAPNSNQTPCPPPRDPEQKWTDPAWIVQAAQAQLENTWWGGEAIPSHLLLCGWLVCFGATPRFRPETIWWDEMEFDFGRPPQLHFDPQAHWPARHEAVYTAMAEFAGRDGFLLGRPCLLPANDLLSMLMGTDNFLMNLMDQPEWMQQAIVMGAQAQAAASQYYRELIEARHDFWYGNAGWMPFWAPEPYRTTQSDVSCMLSPAMFEEFVLPELEILHEASGPLWYHLDGGNARQHLDRLLSLPYLRVLQYTPAPFEPPNGPAHLEFYRRVQAAGKIVHIELSAENVLPLLHELDPARLMLNTHCSSIAAGEELLRQAAKQWISH